MLLSLSVAMKSRNAWQVGTPVKISSIFEVNSFLHRTVIKVVVSLRI